MAFNFSAIINTAATNTAANTYAINTNDSMDFSAVAVDQGAMNDAINDAVQNTLDNLGFGNVSGQVEGGMMDDVFGEFGPSGQGPGNLGGLVGNIGGTLMPEQIDSIQDLMGWAENGAGGGGGDPFGQPTANGALGGNINVEGGGGEGYKFYSDSKTFALEKNETAYVHHVGQSGNDFYAGGSSFTGGKSVDDIDIIQMNKDGSLKQSHFHRDADGTKTLTETTYDKTGKETSKVITIHKHGSAATGSMDPEGNGDGMDGGPQLPQFSDTGGFDFIDDLGQINININIGSGGGEGTPNSSAEDIAQAFGGYVSPFAPTGDNGEGFGADGNSQSVVIVAPPDYVDQQVILIGAIIDPIPFL